MTLSVAPQDIAVTCGTAPQVRLDNQSEGEGAVSHFLGGVAEKGGEGIKPDPGMVTQQSCLTGLMTVVMTQGPPK